MLGKNKGYRRKSKKRRNKKGKNTRSEERGLAHVLSSPCIPTQATQLDPPRRKQGRKERNMHSTKFDIYYYYFIITQNKKRDIQSSREFGSIQVETREITYIIEKLCFKPNKAEGYDTFTVWRKTKQAQLYIKVWTRPRLRRYE